VALSQIDCQTVLEQIELYLDGEVEASLRVEIHRHLELCGPCMDHSEFQLRLKELLRSTCGCDEVPSDLADRIRTMFSDPTD
jgi:mycothiol system anti-sigma-R factor